MSDLRFDDPTRSNHQPQRDFLTPRQFLQAHPGLRRTKLYEDLKASRIPHVRLGRKLLIPADALDRMIAVPTDHT